MVDVKLSPCGDISNSLFNYKILFWTDVSINNKLPNVKQTKEEKLWELNQDLKELQKQQVNRTNVSATTKKLREILLH